MPETLVLPTVVGLAVGIGLVILFGISMNNFHKITEGSDPGAIIVIPEGASNPDSGKTYQPQVIRVVLGVNNTVVWLNEDRMVNWIQADNNNDPVFAKETANSILLEPGTSVQYTFTKTGEYGYHGKPHQRGTVIVLPAYCQVAYLCS